jgi:chromosome segregation ATPase
MVQVATGVDDLTGKMAEGFKSVADEINNDVTAAMKLKGLTQQLRDEEREFNKVRAQTRQEIQKARLEALDESKTVEERLAAVQRANELELKTTEDVLEMQRRKIQIQKETMALSENMAEDLDELAALEVGLIDLQTQSFQTQKRLATEMETLTNEIAANKKAKQKEEADAIKKAADKEIKEAERVAKEKEKLEKELVKIKSDTVAMGFKAGKALAKEGSVAAKGIAVAETIYNTQAAIMQAMKLPPPFNTIQAVATGIMGATSVQKILSTNPEGGGGSVSAPATPTTPAPQMMSGAFELSGGLEPEPMKAFVVTDEMTNSQNQLANIRRRATI